MPLKSVRVLFCECEIEVKRYVATMNFDTDGDSWLAPLKTFLDSTEVSIEKTPLNGVFIAVDSKAPTKGRRPTWGGYSGNLAFIRLENSTDGGAAAIADLEDREVSLIFQALQGRARETARIYILPDSKTEFWLDQVLSDVEVQGKFKNGDKLFTTKIDKARIDFAEIVPKGKESWSGGE